MINYARLLKVAYLAAHFADPTTTVMFGGLLYSTPDNWLARVLAIYENDTNRPLIIGIWMLSPSIITTIHSARVGWTLRYERDITLIAETVRFQ
ncbi:MAG: hypothetical protein Q9P01_08240 [Anaerolineae bacterium]|nr:hypothetical protein [Anaerolineae bacterium]